MRSLRIALAQINPTVGDLEGNAEKIIRYAQMAKKSRAEIVAFPELSVTGYPPEDLLLQPQFVDDNLNALDKIRKHIRDITAVVGFVDRKDDIYNAAAVICNKKVIDIYHKRHLPNYGVFDEYRYFRTGSRCPVYRIGETWFGINICEDIWYPEGPAKKQSLSGAEVIININASPYHIGKGRTREQMLASRASDNMVFIAYLNTVGGQDELVFDGQSLVVNQEGRVLARGRQFEEDLIVLDLEVEDLALKRLHAPQRRREAIKSEKADFEKVILPAGKISGPKRLIRRPQIAVELEPREEIYRALLLGTSDYVSKNGFHGVVIGLSGGIDSALVATIATDALGKSNVTCLFMPSPYTSKESRKDAFALAKNLGVKVREVPIDRIFRGYLQTLAKPFDKLPPDVTEENLQARIRGNILMAFSNKFGWLVLTTGNKSEMSVGYATLYGDMAGGFAVIKDVPKTMVYELCRWKNQASGKMIIPEQMFSKEPSAELKPDQKDSDTLPPYPELDPILKAYVEEDRSLSDVLSLGCEPECARKVIRMIDRSEYKRRQSPPGIKITQRAFGRDRRFPITNKYRGY